MPINMDGDQYYGMIIKVCLSPTCELKVLSDRIGGGDGVHLGIDLIWTVKHLKKL